MGSRTSKTPEMALSAQVLLWAGTACQEGLANPVGSSYVFLASPRMGKVGAGCLGECQVPPWSPCWLVKSPERRKPQFKKCLRKIRP